MAGMMMCEWGKTTPILVKIPADLSRTHQTRWDHKEIDICIAPLVQALQTGGIDMCSSCCGHGEEPGFIELADGRILIITRRLAELTP